MNDSNSNEQFYNRLPVNTISLTELLGEPHLFFKVPANWHVLITDVKSSTKAIASGLHETVNLIATGSIVAVMNLAYKNNITAPFFFGGDGATLIIPGTILDEAKHALVIHQQNTLKSYKLELRVGHLPVEQIYAEGHELRITKLKFNELFSIPVLLGDGLSHAEKIIKGADYRLGLSEIEKEELDLDGMECRWDKIKPPNNYDEVVSLLIVAGEGIAQHEAFKKVIEQIDRIYGSPEQRKPITVPQLKLKATLNKISKEMTVRFGGFRPVFLLRKWLATMFGTFYFRTKKGQGYLNQLVDLSDTLVVDGRINTVISGTQKQREELAAELDSLEKQGLIHYGLFVSQESVMSCYVRSMDKQHIHFVDGSDGGYTRAAGMLKQKLYGYSPISTNAPQ